MNKYLNNPKWGDPKGYDVLVYREKAGDKTVYDVSVNPKEPLDQAIIKEYEAMNINLDAWMKGEDPFANVVSKDEQLAQDVEDILGE